MADIIIISSSREGFPMVIMEAMMHGVVPISTNVGGISTHIKSSETGILINEKDENKIVELIMENLEYFLNNRIILDNLSLNVYNYAQANFRKDVFFDSYRKLLS
jgi:glycosyltransferase involved in cell wall biosynthesis